MKRKNIISKHCRDRYLQRVNASSENPTIDILTHLNIAKDVTNKIYDDDPGYILYLYKKYKKLGQLFLQSGDIIFILNKSSDGVKDKYIVSTCYIYDPLNRINHTNISRKEIFIEIAKIKSVLNKT